MIERTLFNADHEAFRDAFRKFCEKEIAPHHEAWEEAGYVDREVWRKAGANGDLNSWIRAHLSRSDRGDYVALLAYIERDGEHVAALQKMRLAVRDARQLATCAEFGPRFLHSTGQAYKGGPDNGVFLQITADETKDLKVPGQKASFGVIKAAQARGDFDVLTERGRRALRVHLKGDLDAGLKALDAAISAALN